MYFGVTFARDAGGDAADAADAGGDWITVQRRERSFTDFPLFAQTIITYFTKFENL